MIFPAFADDVARAARNVPRGACQPRRLRILVVDDDPVLSRSLQDALETDGHALETALGGQAGIDDVHRRAGHGARSTW